MDGHADGARLRIYAKLQLVIGERTLNVNINPSEASEIVRLKLLTDPPADFHESSGFLRIGRKGTRAEIEDITEVMLRIYAAISRGKPIVWVCSEKHARRYQAFLGQQPGVRVTILRGSRRKDNSSHYSPLKMDWGPVMGGSDDEHIVMLEFLTMDGDGTATSTIPNPKSEDGSNLDKEPAAAGDEA